MNIDLLNQALVGKWLAMQPSDDGKFEAVKIIKCVGTDFEDDVHIVIEGLGAPGMTIETIDVKESRFFETAAEAAASAEKANADEIAARAAA